MSSIDKRDFVDSLNKLITSWYLNKHDKPRESKFLNEDDMKEFIEDVYDYSYYLFSKEDQEVMGNLNNKPSLTLMQGGKKDDDETIN